MTYQELMQRVRSKTAAAVLLILSLFGIPVLIGSLSRIPDMGFQPAMGMQIVALLTLWTTTLLGHRAPHALRTGVPLTVAILVTWAGYLNFGLAGGGPAGAIFTIFLAAILVNHRLGAPLILCVNMLAIGLFGYLHVNGHLTLPATASSHIWTASSHIWSSWFRHLTGLTMMGLIVTYTVYLLRTTLGEHIAEQSGTADDLTALIDTATHQFLVLMSTAG